MFELNSKLNQNKRVFLFETFRVSRGQYPFIGKVKNILNDHDQEVADIWKFDFFYLKPTLCLIEFMQRIMFIKYGPNLSKYL